MKQFENTLLGFGLQVNEQVAATDEIHTRKRRVGDQVLRGEQDPLAEVLTDLKATVVRMKKAFEPSLADGQCRPRRIDAGPGACQCGAVYVGGEDHELSPYSPLLDLLSEQDGHRVGFFAGRAAGHPDA